ncbi:MAG: GAF domain-containing protein [Desulfobacterales bacterium]|nr:MAG: GAF domain-containing protein [Desulfobacterales bacterium]
MSTHELVDISLDFQSRRYRARRRLLRVGIPIGCLVIMIAAIAAIALVTYVNNRDDALALSADILETLDRRIATEIRAYLTPASNVVNIAARLFKDQIAQDGLPHGAPFGLEVLNFYPQLANFNVGDPQGNFLMHKKMPDGSIHTKIMERSGNDYVRVTWIRRDRQGQIVAQEASTGDTYDPRTRPWYRGAVENRGLFWSDVYIFFTDKKPGITTSFPIFIAPDQLLAVVSLDVALEQLSSFLASLEIGINGRAMIIDEHGYLVAYPVMAKMFKEDGGQLKPVKLDDMDDPILARTYHRFQIEGYGSRSLVVDNRKYISTVSSLASTVGRGWSAVMVVPQDDFVGFVAENSRKAMIMASGIIILAAFMAVLLVYQGLKSDRNANLLLERQRELESQSRAFAELSSKASLFDPADSQSLEAVSEIIVATVGARRVGIWRFSPDGQTLICEDCYDRESDGHMQGTSLKYEDFPQFFDELRSGKDIIAADAGADDRTVELYRAYLRPLGSEAILVLPIQHQGQTAGAVWLEHEVRSRRWHTQEITFARAIANMVSIRVAAQSGFNLNCSTPDSQDGAAPSGAARSSDPTTGGGTAPAPKKVPAANLEPSGSTVERTKAPSRPPASAAEWLNTRGGKYGQIGADVFVDAAVLVLRLNDAIALAENIGEDKGTLAIDHLTCHIEEMAARYGIEYLKILDDRFVCVTGVKDADQDHAARVSEFALSIQEACLRVFTELDRRMEFRIGIDCGAVIGGSVGRRSKSYLLWGEAVRVAGMMAETGADGGIQVSESAYRRLQTNYLFKVRGSYYLPKIGEIKTYLLTGRL